MDSPNNLSLRDKIEWIIKELKKLRRGGGGSGGAETDPTVPSHVKSITSTDITNWNNKLSAEADTLEIVVNRGNYTPRYMTFTGTTAAPTRDGAIGMNTTTYSMYFGNMNPTHTGTWNIGVGYNTLNNLSSGTENTAFGHYSLSNLTVGTENIAIGNQTLNSLAGTAIESRWNIAIGENVGRYLPKASGNVFIGTYTAKNLSSGVTEADLSAISPAAVAYMKLVPDLSGYNASTASFNSALNTFVGQSINETSSTPTRAAMSTIIGASGLYNVKFRNFNNIVIGAGNYMTVANGTMYNSIVIGNSVNLPNQVDVLAIGMSRAGRINSQDAIIYGLLPNTQLTFNAPITVPSTYMRNATGDTSYTKDIVAKPNGDIGWDDRLIQTIPTITSVFGDTTSVRVIRTGKELTLNFNKYINSTELSTALGANSFITICTLPTGYRPPGEIRLPILTYNGFRLARIFSTGEVLFYPSANVDGSSTTQSGEGQYNLNISFQVN